METATPSLGDLAAACIRAELGRRRQSQAQLAELIGQNQVWISRRLRGAVPLTVDDVALIARALGVEVVELLGQQAA